MDKILVSATLHVNDGKKSISVTIPTIKRGKAGIYRIINVLTGEYYIGQSRDIPKRWNRHLNDLKNRIHINPKLQGVYNSIGEHGLSFEVILHCRESELCFYENLLIKHLNPAYNFKSIKQLKGGQ